MGCACQDNTGPRVYPPGTDTGTMSFVLQMQDGSSSTYGSRLEADAANARSGYLGVVRVISV